MSVDKDLTVSEEEENAFEASFNATDLEPSALIEEPAPDEEPEPQDEPTEGPDPAAIPEEMSIKDLIEMIKRQNEKIDNQDRELIKTRDTLNGKYGTLLQKYEAAKKSTAGFSPKAKDRLLVDFPELAEMLFDDDGDAEPEAPSPPDPLPRYEPQEDKVDKIRQEMELKFLARDHKDWKAVVGSQEFIAWRENTLDPEKALELDSTWDSGIISERLTEFKTWKTTSQKKQTANTARLESAITPRGLPRGNSPSILDDDEDAAMEAAFRKRN